MTTNRMGLTPEQSANTFTDEQLESLVYGNNPQSNVYRELLAWRKVSKKPVGEVVAWGEKIPARQGINRRVDFRWLDIDVMPGTKLYATPQLHAVTVPDEVTFEQARLMAYGLTPAEAFQKAWSHLRGTILKSATNEP